MLTFTNEEAGQVAALLAHKGIPARVVQQQKEFMLSHLRELRLFSEQVLSSCEGPIIDEAVWQSARERLKAAFAKSDKLAQCLRVIESFEAMNNVRKYKSDWTGFLHESRWEDFSFDGQAQVTISTMHKAKGREFDQVVVLLHRFQEQDAACRRLLYVAATRARHHLVLHADVAFINRFDLDGLMYCRDQQQYPEPGRIRLQLGHEDVYLSYFSYVQGRIISLRPGDTLCVLPEGLGNQQGQHVLKFSKKFQERLSGLARRRYHPLAAWVEFIVWWKDEQVGAEQQVVLAVLELEIKH